MKKITLLAVATILTLSLAACSTNTHTDTSALNKAEPPKMQVYMGQVKDIVGNDVTLSLGNLMIENDGGDNQAMMVDENGNQIPVEGDISPDPGSQMVLIPMPDDSENSGDTTEGGEIEKLPIEFTGDVRDFTIPAGAKILNGVGKEITLDSVKKGSLVQLIINESSGVVESVMVW